MVTRKDAYSFREQSFCHIASERKEKNKEKKKKKLF